MARNQIAFYAAALELDLPLAASTAKRSRL